MKKRGAFFYVIIALVLVCIAGLTYFLAPGREPDTAPVLLPTPAPTDAGVGGSGTPDSAVLAVTPDTVQTVIATLHRADIYYRVLNVQDFWSGGSRSRQIEVWAHGDQLRLSVTASSAAARQQLLIRGSEKWLWYPDSDRVFHGSLLDGEPDAYQTISRYEEVLTLPLSDILEAGYTDFGGSFCIFVRYRSGGADSGMETLCYIDPVTGLLMGERCYDGQQLVYSMDSSVPDLSTPDAAVFTLPNQAEN